MQEEQSQKAITQARKDGKNIAKDLTSQFKPSEESLAIFMAGAPGAGKTEFSEEIISRSESQSIIHIDGDKLRTYFDGYTGDNSHQFQTAMSLVVEKILDQVYKKKVSFILDGTLSSYTVAEKNLKRALRKNRVVLIYFIYQEPKVSWMFTQRREGVEGRRITKEIFIEKYFGSIDTMKQILDNPDFTGKIKIYPIYKNYNEKTKKTEKVYYKPFMAGKVPIDQYIKASYNKNQLRELLCD